MTIMEEIKKRIGGDVPEGKALILLVRGGEIRRYGDPLSVAMDGEMLNQHCVGASHGYGDVGFRVVAIQKEKGVVSSREFVGEKLFREFAYESRMRL